MIFLFCCFNLRVILSSKVMTAVKVTWLSPPATSAESKFFQTVMEMITDFFQSEIDADLDNVILILRLKYNQEQSKICTLTQQVEVSHRSLSSDVLSMILLPKVFVGLFFRFVKNKISDRNYISAFYNSFENLQAFNFYLRNFFFLKKCHLLNTIA